MTPEEYKAQMMRLHPGAFGINVPGAPDAAPQAPGISPGMLGGGMGGPQPPPSPLAAQPPQMGPPPQMQPPSMDAALAQGPGLEQQLPMVGPPKPAVDPNAIPESALDALLQTPVDQGELTGLMEQRERANALRDTALPEGRQAGRTFVAANPLEFIGAGIKQYRGGKQSKALDTEIGGKRAKIGKQQGEYTKEAAKQGGLSILFDKIKGKKKDDNSSD
jgi:hypothetical protein